ncbi:radical SAM family heme chaperone HemW [Coxiella burnetii]|uniref:radical SAM family heme chaperone HemW n=1 Tax=Coxiella burnetii TaxID=777 RepID=UPI0005AD1282|nr:radical SAM family heme chaperone HemW [Coxiella burnetii]
MSAIPLSFYIHMPWCIRKCPYCDFNSHALHQDLPEDAYINALINELRQQIALIEKRPIHTIFIGGGTPSLFSQTAYQKLFEEIKKQCLLKKEVEITLEANPGSVEQTKFRGYREIGINRLSIGVQSFQNDKLKVLGRIHSAEEAKQAINIAKQAGFENINVDLMFGLPDQKVNEALDDLQTALDLEPTHLSWYQLTLEPNTFFYKHPPALPTDDYIWEIQSKGRKLLRRDGFAHYEVSAYSRSNRFCQHNINYWEFGDYLGLGAGAHSKLTIQGKITRYWNIKNPRFYMDAQKPFIEGRQTLAPNELPLEFMMNALRLQKPIPLTLFTERTGLSPSVLVPWLETAKERNLLQCDNKYLTVTPLGHRFLNELLILL